MHTLQKLKFWLVVAFAAETFCITYGLKSPPLIPFFSVVYFISGIAIAVLLLYFPEGRLQGPGQGLSKFLFSYKPVFLIVFGFIVYYLSKYAFNTVPVDIEHADMLPIIKVMDHRFVSGQWKHIYEPIPEIWDGAKPIYLPATWLPFSLSTIFNFDLRWITAACVLFTFSVSFFILHPQKKSLFSLFIIMIASMLFWWLMTEDETHGFLTVSEEGVVVAYYVMLVLALLSGNIYFTGIAISLCMLSRYALIGWVPAFIIYLILNKKKKELFVLPVTGIALFFGLFILPFGWDAFRELLQLPGNYIEFAKRVWKDSPEVFSESMGFAQFFGPGRITLLHNMLILLTFTVPVLFVLYCFYQSRKRKISNIHLASLKLGLVVFYSFIDVPYLYLFYTSSFISLVLVAFFIAGDDQSEKAVA